MIIDSHTHLYDMGFLPGKWYDAAARQWAFGKMPYRNPDIIRPKIESGLVDPDGRLMIGDMDAAGVDAIVVLAVDFSLGVGEEALVPMEEVHRRYGVLQKQYPGRFYAFGGVDPRRSNAVEIFEHAITQHGLKGFKCYPACGYYPYDSSLYPIFEICASMGMPVLTHTGRITYPLKARFTHPIHLADVQADFPNLILWFGHAGCPLWWEECVEVASGGVNSYLEVSMWQELAYGDEEAFIRKLAHGRDVLGAHRLLFGSDHYSGARFSGSRSQMGPWVMWWHELPDRAKKYGVSFTTEEVDLILGGNAARCLGLN
jgi:predicted TIM-barrel fold metal-dependent hydrolase